MATRTLYIGTREGLYQATATDGAWAARLLGLESPPAPKEFWHHHRGVHPAGKGAIRCPVVVDRADSDRLYAATDRAGVFRSDDAGRTWRATNEGLVYKEVWSLAQHPVTGELYAGTGPSALFRSQDDGETWLECQALRFLPTTRRWTFPTPPHVSHIKHVELSADDPTLLYCAIEEGGVIRSRDGGASWEQADATNGIYEDVHTVNAMPDAPAVLVATTGRGVYRSLDGGDSWRPSSEGLGSRLYVAHLVRHPVRPHVMFTAAAGTTPRDWPRGADTAFFRSDDRGASWRALPGDPPEPLAAGPRCVAGDPEDPEAVFVGLADGTVWMTDDGGRSLREIIRGLPQVTSIRVVHR